MLEGGRWLLSLGDNLSNYNAEYGRAVLAYDLDSPQFASTIIYSSEHNMVLMKIFAQVDRSQSCLAFTVGLLFEDRNNPRKVSIHTEILNVAYSHIQEIRRFDILGIEQKGRGSGAKHITSTIKSLSCENVGH